MQDHDDIVSKYRERYDSRKTQEYSLGEYLELCKKDPTTYATAAERMLMAIGKSSIVDTSKDERFSRIFMNRKIRTYKSFESFYGMEETIQKIVSFFKHAAQGLEEKKQILYLLGPVGGGKTHRKGTQISMADGSLKNIEDVTSGDVVVCHTTTGQKTTRKVLDTIISQPKQVIQLTTKKGWTVEGAPTHPLLTENGWVKLGDISEQSDFIAIAKEQIFGQCTPNPNLLKVYAYLIGDGNIGTYRDTITFTNKNPIIIQDFLNACEEIGVDAVYHPKGTYCSINGNKQDFIEQLKNVQLFGKYSYEKTIPSIVFKSDKKTVSSFLQALYATDGWASVSIDKKRLRKKSNTFVTKTEIGYCTTSMVLATQLTQLLAKYGIIASLRTREHLNEKHQTSYTVSITSSENIITFAKEIGIIGKTKSVEACVEHALTVDIGTTGRFVPKNIARNLIESVSCSKNDGSTRLKDMIRTTTANQTTVSHEVLRNFSELTGGNKDLTNFLQANYFWDKITSVKVTTIEEPMYDLEIEEHHNYIANGFISHNSSIVDHLKELFESVPFYTLKAGGKISPLYEMPLCLFDEKEDGPLFEQKYNIPADALKIIMSPWATKRLEEFGGDVSQFTVVKLYPSQLRRIGISKVEPGDENNQDISSLVGKVDIRKLEEYSQDDPDSYSYSGALNVTPQGIVDFAEMFKSNIKTLHPLLDATQGGCYNGTEGMAALPFGGVIIAHSNEAEWEMFRNNKRNEAFIDRLSLVKVPYCLRVTEEVEIYKKLIGNSILRKAHCAPGTLDMLAQFSVLTRLEKPENSPLFTKMEIYDGKNLKDKDPAAKSLQEYRDAAGVHEGMVGSSTRFAYKILSQTYNFDSTEIAANPVHLTYVLEKQIMQESLPPALEEQYITFIKGILVPRYGQFLSNEIQKAYLESYGEYGQNLFDRYIHYADAWIQDIDFHDPDTGEMYDRSALNAELEKVEKPAGIGNPKDFRNEVVGFVIRASRNNDGRNPSWTSYEKLREVIEKKMFASTEDLLPIISFTGKKASKEEEEKHNDFVKRMMDKGYTNKQVRLLVEWFMRYKKNS
jgi:serine protein kinase